MSYKQLFVVGGLFLACVLSYAQTPPKMSYQGLLTTSSGTPVQDGNYNLKFDIYNLPSAGTLKHTETHSSVPVQRGTFSVILGPLPAIFVESLYVEVTALAGPGISSPVTFSPRSELTAAPYALAPWSIIGSDIAYLTNGNVGIGTASPVSPLHVSGSMGPSLNGVLTVDNTAAGGNAIVARSNNGPLSWAIWGQANGGGFGGYFQGKGYFSGNVGIGTTNPASPLEVAGLIHSTLGGYKFPDGSIQATAAGGVGNSWLLNGNATVAGNFLGTTNGNSLELKVNNTRVFRMDPTAGTPNIIGGFSGNNIPGGSVGATISGGGVVGFTNQASGSYPTVGGGSGNTASASWATIGGGYLNSAVGQWSTIPGGEENAATGTWGAVGGGNKNNANGLLSTIGGGYNNAANGDSSTIGGGTTNTILPGSLSATIGGGSHNTASAQASVIGGGQANNVGPGMGTTVGGGLNNQANITMATVAGGGNNLAQWTAATVGGGLSDTAFGDYSTVPGGRDNKALGQYSLASGYKAKANHNGTFVWSDASGIDFVSTASNQFLIRASGNVGINTNAPGSMLTVNGQIHSMAGGIKFPDNTVQLTAALGGGGGWNLLGNAIVAGDFLGTTNNLPLVLKANNAVVSTFTPLAGTATIVSGWSGNNGWASTGATISGGGGPLVGSQNVTDDFCTIGGGAQNQAGNNNPNPTDAMFATVGGGIGNFASGAQSTVGGGLNNIASGSSATIAGGDQNIANSMHATVGGGWMNNAGKTFSVVAGGVNNNMATGPAGGADTTAIGGGAINDVFDHAGTIAGGTHNAAGSNNGILTDATHATVGGGFQNTAGAAYATISGGQSNTAGALQGTIGGGFGNAVGPGAGTTVGGGLSNQAQITGATVGGGMNNIAGQTVATVGGGMENSAIGPQSTVSGGSGNVAVGQTSTIGGGHMNQIQADLATISGGAMNAVGPSGTFAVIPGGEQNQAMADHSFAAGWQAQALHQGAFVWADAFNAPAGQPFASVRNNQFAVRAQGGAYFEVTSQVPPAPPPPIHWVNIFNDGINLITTSTNARLTLGGTWTNASDRNLKENFTAVNGRDVLEKLSRLPISLWNYKAESAEIRHMGPTAQDFYELFGLGGSDKTISTIDPSGVALAAIQELYKQNQELLARVANLEAMVKSLTATQHSDEGAPIGERR